MTPTNLEDGESDSAKRFGAKFKELRTKKKALTQEKMGELTGFGNDRISKIQTGKSPPLFEDLIDRHIPIFVANKIIKTASTALEFIEILYDLTQDDAVDALERITTGVNAFKDPELRGRDFTSEAADFKLTIPEALAKYPGTEPIGKPEDFGAEIASQQVREIIESVVKQKLDELNATTTSDHVVEDRVLDEERIVKNVLAHIRQAQEQQREGVDENQVLGIVRPYIDEVFSRIEQLNSQANPPEQKVGVARALGDDEILWSVLNAVKRTTSDPLEIEKIWSELRIEEHLSHLRRPRQLEFVLESLPKLPNWDFEKIRWLEWATLETAQHLAGPQSALNVVADHSNDLSRIALLAIEKSTTIDADPSLAIDELSSILALPPDPILKWLNDISKLSLLEIRVEFKRCVMSRETAEFLSAQYLIYRGTIGNLPRDPLWLYRWSGVLQQAVLIYSYKRQTYKLTQIFQSVFRALDGNAKPLEIFWRFIYLLLSGDRYRFFMHKLYDEDLIHCAELINVIRSVSDNEDFTPVYGSAENELCHRWETTKVDYAKQQFAYTLCKIGSTVFREGLLNLLSNIHIRREELEDYLLYLSKLGGNRVVKRLHALCDSVYVYRCLIEKKYLQEGTLILAFGYRHQDYRREFFRIIERTTKSLPFSDRTDLFKSFVHSNKFSSIEKGASIDSLAAIDYLPAVWELRRLSESGDKNIVNGAQRVLLDILSPVGAVAIADKLQQVQRDGNLKSLAVTLRATSEFVSDAAHFQHAVYLCVINVLEEIRSDTAVSPDLQSRANEIIKMALRYRAKLAAGIPLYQSDSGEVRPPIL